MKSFDQFVLTNRVEKLFESIIESEINAKDYWKEVAYPIIENKEFVNEFQLVNELFGGIKDWMFKKANELGLSNDPRYNSTLQAQDKERQAREKEARKEKRSSVAAMRKGYVDPRKALGGLQKADAAKAKEWKTRETSLQKYAQELGNEFRANLQSYLDTSERKFLTLTKGEDEDHKKYTVLKNMHDAIQDAVERIIDKYSKLRLVSKSNINPFEPNTLMKNYKIPTSDAGEAEAS
jgi:hypothetical protein